MTAITELLEFTLAKTGYRRTPTHARALFVKLGGFSTVLLRLTSSHSFAACTSSVRVLQEVGGRGVCVYALKTTRELEE